MIGPVHEIVHLQRNVSDEHSVWSEVNAQVVRPLRQLSQPMHPRFLQVDDALRACGDRLPCPKLGRLVRVRM